MNINLNNVQHEPIVVTGDITAANNRYYVQTATATYTDPTPASGEGYIVFVRNGTATIGGTNYSSAGNLVFRYYHSGAWANYLISDASGFQPLDADLTSIASLTGTSAYLRRSAANTYVLDSYSTVASNLPSTGITAKLLTGGTFLNSNFNTTDSILQAFQYIDGQDLSKLDNVLLIDNGSGSGTTVNVGQIVCGNASNIADIKTLSLNATGGTFGIDGSGVLTFPNAGAATRGLLTSGDYITFNNKQDALGYTPVRATYFTELSYSSNYRPAKRVVGGTISSTTGYSGLVIYQKIVPEKTITVTSISVVCSTGSAGQSCRMGLYTSTTGVGQLPDALISGTDTGTIDCTSTGLKEGTITATTLNAGTTYWVCFQSGNAALGFRNVQGGEMDILNTSDYLYYANIRKAAAYGAPPATAGSGFSYGTPSSAYSLLTYLKIQ